MGNYKCVPRKKRRDKLTIKCEKLFSHAIKEKNYYKAGLIAFYNALKNYGAKGLLNALDNGNSLFIRKGLRRGLL